MASAATSGASGFLLGDDAAVGGDAADGDALPPVSIGVMAFLVPAAAAGAGGAAAAASAPSGSCVDAGMPRTSAELTVLGGVRYAGRRALRWAARATTRRVSYHY